MALDLNIPSSIQKISHPLWEDQGVELWIKRDDLIHPEISGNKWRKLKNYVIRHQMSGKEKILSFGGAYSNHLAALAALGREMDIPTIGIIRGEELTATSNTTLKALKENGMELCFVSRSTYKERHGQYYWQQLRDEWGAITIIPEGGVGYDGMIGVSELVDEVDFHFDTWHIPVGTATTLAGVMWQTNTKIYAYVGMKKYMEQQENVRKLLTWGGLLEEDISLKERQVTWLSTSEYGTFGNLTESAQEAIKDWSTIIDVPLDGIYNGKMWLKLVELLKQKHFSEGSKILFLHTGGLQGNEGVGLS